MAGRYIDEKQFENHPEVSGTDFVRGVFVDVTPSKEMPTFDGTGTRLCFSFVLESEELMEDGRPYLVRSKLYAESWHVNSNLTKDFPIMMGKTLAECKDSEGKIDLDDIIGKTVKFQVKHGVSDKTGIAFANAHNWVSKEGKKKTPVPPLEPSGHYVRIQDRDNNQFRAQPNPRCSDFKKSAPAAEKAATLPTKQEDRGYAQAVSTVLHLGKLKDKTLGGLLSLGERGIAVIQSLINEWVPTVDEAAAINSASLEDQNLRAALQVLGTQHKDLTWPWADAPAAEEDEEEDLDWR